MGRKVGKAAMREAAAEFGRMGGLLGGPARARKLSARRRQEIARKAGQASQRARRRRLRNGDA